MEAEQTLIEKISPSDLVKAISKEVSKHISEDKVKREAESSPEYISPLEVSNIFNVSVTTIYNWEHKGYFKGYRIGGRKRYLKTEVLTYAESCKNKE